MTSRTVRSCQQILKALIKEYGPFARVGKPLVDKQIIQNAGGDPRTVDRYFNQMILLDFVKTESDGTFTFNLTKVDYAQLSLQESLMVDEPP